MSHRPVSTHTMKSNTTTVLRELVFSSIRAMETYDDTIARLREYFANQTDAKVRAALLPVVGEYYNVPTSATGFVKPTAENKIEKSKWEAARKRLTRLVDAICCVSVSKDLTPAQRSAAQVAAAVKAVGKLTPAQKRKVLDSLASELGLKVK